MNRNGKKIIPATWAARWAMVSGVRAYFNGMNNDGRAGVKIDGGRVEFLTACDVAEVIGEMSSGARFSAGGCLILRSGR